MAHLFDSDGDDLVTVRASFTSIEDSHRLIRAHRFDAVTAHRTLGGSDVTNKTSVDDLFTQVGQWES